MGELLATGKCALHNLVFCSFVMIRTYHSACCEVNVGKVYIREFAWSGCIIIVAPHHHSHTAEVFAVQGSGYAQLGVFVKMVAHQLGQFTCFV